jgi:beta-lactamase class A
VRRAGIATAVFALTVATLGGCGDGSAAPSARASASASSTSGTSGTSGTSTAADTARSLADLERRFHARVGLYLLDTGTGRSVAYRSESRFAHCSTVKALAAGALLRRESDAQLDQVVSYTTSQLVDYSPITSPHAGHGMTLRALIAAALEYSDNTAENLMVGRLGGPAGLQKAVRLLNDTTTNVNRTEPSLNEAIPGDTRDTSTALALGTDLRSLLLGNALPAERRALLTGWMTHNTTGGPYIRAAVPKSWKVADKTGSGDYGTRNDIAIAWPPRAAAPVVISVLTDRGTPDAHSDDALIAQAVTIGLTALHR